MNTVSLEEAQAHLPELLEKVAGGQEIIITRDDMPLAQLTPIRSLEGRVRVTLITQEPPKPPPSLLKFGKYQTGPVSTLEDFEDAQWHGEAEFDPNGT